MSSLKELYERRVTLQAKAGAFIPKSGPMSLEAKDKFDNLQVEIGDISADIRRIESQRQHQAEDGDWAEWRSSIASRRGVYPAFEPSNRLNAADSVDAGWSFEESDEANRYRKAFRHFLQSGYNGERFGLPRLSEEDRGILRYERRDMGVGSPTASVPTSVLVPQGFAHDIEVAIKFYGPMTQVSKILDTATGAPLPYPTANDTTQVASVIGEGQQVSEEDVSVGNIIFGAWKLSSGLVKVSLELLQDSAFDMETFLKERFGERFGRGLNTLFTNGTGSSQPTGFTVNAVAGPTAVGSSGNDGGAETGGTSIGTTDIVNLIQSIDPWYRPGSIFQMHDQTRAHLESRLDKFGRPLFTPDPQTGRLERLFGYPLYLNNDLPTIAVNAKTIYFGRFDKYVVRRVKDISVLRLVERFADYGQVAFIGFARYDGNLLDAGTHPIKYLVQAAS